MRISIVYIILLNLVCSVTLLGQQTYPYYGQNFVVHYFNDSYWVSKCGCPNNVGSESTLNLGGGGRPLVVDVTTTCDSPTRHNKYCTFDLSTADCYSDTYISWEPYNLKLTGPAPDTYCSSQSITINASSAYHSYAWQYQIVNSSGSSGWKPLSGFSGSSVTFNFSTIPGAQLGDNIYFRYSVVGCNPISSVIGPYSFLQDALYVTGVSSQAPTCSGGDDGSVQVTLNRGLYSGETIATFDFYNSSSYTTTTTTVTDPQSGIIYTKTSYDLPAEAFPMAPVSIDANKQGTINNVPVGTYYILVRTNQGGCGAPQFLTAATVSSGPRNNLSATTAVISDYHGSQISCHGLGDGKVTVSAVGGGGSKGSYQYSLDGVNFSTATNNTSYTFSSVGPGTYSSVKVKDDGCTAMTATTSVTISEPDAITNTPTASLCNGINDGSITVSASGGTGSYSYSCDVCTGSASSNVFSGQTSGLSYKITVTDQNNCSTSSSVVVPSPVSVGPVSVIHPNCVGATTSTGVINITASGGTSPLKWSIDGSQWSTPGTAIVGVQPNTTIQPYYSVTVKDANNCTATINSVVVNQPITAGYTPTVASCSTVNDGTITVTGASGGTNSFQYFLNGGAYPPNSAPDNNVFSNLPSGSSYTISVKDVNTGCVFTINNGQVDVKTPVFTANAPTQTASINCYGETTAAFNVTASNGTAPYTYVWSNGTPGPSVSNVGAGTYSVNVTDGKGCKGSSSITIDQPDQLDIGTPALSIHNGFNISCKGGSNGSISVTPAGGTLPYKSYSWSTGSSTTSNSWPSGASTQDISGLPKGSYDVKVTDNNGCKATASVNMTEPQKAVLVDEQSKSNVTCFGFNDGEITVTGSGGVGALHYKDSTATGASVYQLSNSLVSLTADTYFIRAKDANGCVAITPAIVVNTPDPLSIGSIIKTDPDCNGAATGSIQVNGSGGGTTPYQYSIDGVNYSSTPVFSSLPSVPGGYTITMKDATGICNTSSTAQVLTDPPLLTVSVTSVSESYAFAGDGKINVSALGGKGAKAYSIDGVTFQAGATFTNLAGGLYTITVKDAHNCSQTVDSFVASTPPPPSSITCSSGQVLSVSTTNQKDPTCGLSNGSAQVTASGGSGTLSYQWLDVLGHPLGNSASLQNANSGTYNVRVTDSNQCVVGTSVTLLPYVAAQLSITNIKSTLCNTSIDGSATVQVSSIQSPYSIQWSSGETTASAVKLKSGQNTITTTDANGCSVTKTFQVPSPPAITAVKETAINPTCAGGSDGSIQVIVTGGTGAMSYSWNGTAGGNAIQNVKAGTYNLIIKDASNCTFTKSYSITDPIPFAIDLGPDVTICPKTTTQIGLTLPNATYSWSGPNGFTSTAGVVNVGDAGTYLLKLINAIGCQATDDIAISISNNLLKSDFLMVSEASVGDTIIVIDISWPVPDQVEWHLGDSATVFHADNDYALISYTDPGTYTVGVKATMGGCSDEYTQHIIIDKEKKNKGGREESEPAINTFIAYPNPFEGRTNVGIVLSQAGSASIKVYSLSTNLLIVSHQFEGEKNYDVELDLSAREAGVYIIVLEAASKTKSVKVIKL